MVAIASLAGTQQSMAQSESRLTCLSGNKVAPSKIGEYLDYELKFENSENDITVKLSIDQNQFDISTLVILSSCYDSEITTSNSNPLILLKPHRCCARGLPCCTQPGGSGGILFRVKTKTDVEVGDLLLLNATIKMDNSLVIKQTNIEQTVFTNGTSALVDSSITAYPIPADSNLTVTCNSVIRSVDLLNEQNQIMETIFADEPSKSFDISTKLDGVYYVRVTSDNGQKVIRIVKQ
ncbi:MAG: T9SS type A sorting domain-containing protein [Flavobacterium sp.]|uniref:T9SS type A sorting domain-containing protein n=1 Tax=Flavobacterium sp. TaxID=239 RepID=UPI0022C338EA|nr:T9SS type A sorting domain-containing protein [Flavobacterium sp.]MCZ8197342.1 T9SS type A sorting domain-containing protein [Flavobacterium sp.]